MFREWGFLLTEMFGLILLAALLGLLVGWWIWARNAGVSKEEFGALVKERDRIRGDLRSCKKMHDEKDGRIATLEGELLTLRERATEYDAQIAQATAASDALRAELNSAEAEVDAARAETAAAKAQADAARSDAEMALRAAEAARKAAEDASIEAESARVFMTSASPMAVSAPVRRKKRTPEQEATRRAEMLRRKKQKLAEKAAALSAGAAATPSVVAAGPQLHIPAPKTLPEGDVPLSQLVPDFDGDGVHEGKDEGIRPQSLSAPRAAGADDLKQIKGIGEKLEDLCFSLGFYHFDQIANWSDAEVAWVDANLEGFRGRVSRDKWVEQARVLASGGTTEFAERVKDGDVY